MAYIDVVGPHLAPGFVYSELVKRTPRHMLPPEKWWARMVRPLQLANLLRERMLARGARGLRIQAAYRPMGGAKNSAHKSNRALDLDLLPGDTTPELKSAFYEEAVKIWCEIGHDESIGLGLYCPRGKLAGLRVHIDVGHASKSRTWQNVPTVRPPAARVIAAKLGLAAP